MDGLHLVENEIEVSRAVIRKHFFAVLRLMFEILWRLFLAGRFTFDRFEEGLFNQHLVCLQGLGIICIAFDVLPETGEQVVL